MMRKRFALVVVACTALLACSQKQDAAGSSASQVVPHKLETVTLGGEGRGDYLFADVPARRLYVTQTHTVHILDLDTLEQLGEITGLDKAQGVAIVPDLNRGFISDGPANQVIMFDPDTSKVLKKIPAGKKPDRIMLDPFSRQILAFDGISQEVSVIDPAKGEVVKTIALADKPEFSRTDGKGKVWVNLEHSGAIAEIDTKAMAVTAKYPLDGCDEPSGLAFDASARLLFATCSNNQLKVVEADTGKVTATVAIGPDADGAVYDPQRRMIFVTNRDGTMTAIKQLVGGGFEPTTIPTQVYAKTVDLDGRTGRLFSSTADLVWPDMSDPKNANALPDAKPGTFRLLVIS